MVYRDSKRRKILGVNFYVGDANGAIDRIARGGLLVVPAAPALKEIAHNAAYRAALLDADLAITDSALMVLAWNIMERDSIRRLSGLEYLGELLKREEVRKPGNTLWIMASPEGAEKNLAWLREQGIEVPQDCVYLAPMYSEPIEDSVLLEKINTLKVRHVLVTVGGGTQERLGHYLKLNLKYLPAIHCIGAAIAFLSGDQVRVPMWVDRLYLGWLLRCLASPRRFVPRYLSARNLLPLLWRFRSRLPVEG
ncbi:MAG: WecB/TagA/CpsF family glycosyltransferase [Acidobacteriota bacterium]|nr:WecB/TagA/CpsF family glycosyltransferase [Acidobacteriota bacterium]